MRWPRRMARLTIFAVISLMALVVIMVAAVYIHQSERLKTDLPPPERVAALVRLVDAAPPDQRELLLEAASDLIFRPSIVESGDAPDAQIERLADTETLAPYQEALGPRPLEIRVLSYYPLRALLFGDHPTTRSMLEFWIGLSNGDILRIRTRNVLALTRTGLPVGLGAGLLGTLAAVIAIFLMIRETKPLAELAEAVDQIDFDSDYVELPDVRRNSPEIRAVADAFNRLQKRLWSMLRTRMAYVGGISHDVRTFATRLRLRVELIPEESERSRAVADIEDMITMLDDALLSVRAGAGELSQELIDIHELVGDEIADLREKDIPVVWRPQTDNEVLVLADRLALRRILSNLVDNGVKYGTASRVGMTVDADTVHLVFEDEGEGIPEEQRDVMLEPFSRLEQSRSRDTGGAGLGLSVVRTLCEAQGGAVALDSGANGCARVTVSLPVFSGD